MKALVTNDDGIHAPGLWQAVEALAQVAEVVVVAPDREQSGVGTAITLRNPLRATEVPPRVPGVEAFVVEGTPADCAILALESLVGPVDLLVSGINQGANLGEDVFVSGTVGAAVQGRLRGIPSAAISVAAVKDLHYGGAAALVRALARCLGARAQSYPLLLNVNLPNVPQDQVQGVDITRLGRRNSMYKVNKGDNDGGEHLWITRGKPDWEVVEGTDIWSIRQRRASITPLQLDMTSMELLGSLSQLKEELALLFTHA